MNYTYNGFTNNVEELVVFFDEGSIAKAKQRFEVLWKSIEAAEVTDKQWRSAEEKVRQLRQSSRTRRSDSEASLDEDRRMSMPSESSTRPVGAPFLSDW